MGILHPHTYTSYLPACLVNLLLQAGIDRIGLDIQSQTHCLSTSYSHSHTHTHTHTHSLTHTLDWSQCLPSACVCMLAYCTRECVILMCESEWMGVEMSLLIFGKYRRSGCYMLSGPTLFLWRKFRLKFVLKVQFGLKSLRALKARKVFFLFDFDMNCTWFDSKRKGRKGPLPV